MQRCDCRRGNPVAGGPMSAASSLRAVPDPFTPAEIAHYYKVRAPQVKQAGSEWRGPCTLHHGTRDSFAVDPKMGRFGQFAEGPSGGRRGQSSPLTITSMKTANCCFSVCATSPKPSVSGARTGAADGSQTSREYAACYSGCRKSGKRKRFWSPKVKRMSSAW